METERKPEVESAVRIIGGKKCILFVDDEEALVQLGKGMLSGLGYEVIGRTSSTEALELFHARPNIPLILCTGFSETITPEKAKAIGFKDFIMKPLIRRQVAEAIRRVLDHKEGMIKDSVKWEKF